MRGLSLFRCTIILVGCLILGIVASEAYAQKAKRVPLKLHESEVSFVGDDSFISGRFTWEPLPRDHIWKETLTIGGGYMNYYELSPNYFYNSDQLNNAPKGLVRSWNRAKGTRKKGLTLQVNDVKKSKYQYGKYHYAIMSNENGSCINAKQFLGDDSAGSFVSSGNKSVFVGACWSLARGSAQELEAIVHKLMNQVRFDEGKINDAKAAGGYKVPAPVAKQQKPTNKSDGSTEARLRQLKDLEQKGLIDSNEAKTMREQILAKLTGLSSTNSILRMPVKLNWEGVSETSQGIIEVDSSNKSGKGKLRFSRNGILCNGYWSYSQGSYNGSGKVQGTWTISCPDGVSAGGNYSSTQREKGTGVGTDNQGRKITFSYGK
jgi:hypothetical protein